MIRFVVNFVGLCFSFLQGRIGLPGQPGYNGEKGDRGEPGPIVRQFYS